MAKSATERGEDFRTRLVHVAPEAKESTLKNNHNALALTNVLSNFSSADVSHIISAALVFNPDPNSGPGNSVAGQD
jgi:hypothetical protein